MNTRSSSIGPVGDRIVAWLCYTVAFAFVGFFALVTMVMDGMSGETSPGWEAKFLSAIAVLLFDLSLKQLFWRAPIGAMRFGVGYLIVVGAIATWVKLM